MDTSNDGQTSDEKDEKTQRIQQENEAAKHFILFIADVMARETNPEIMDMGYEEEEEEGDQIHVAGWDTIQKNILNPNSTSTNQQKKLFLQIHQQFEQFRTHMATWRRQSLAHHHLLEDHQHFRVYTANLNAIHQANLQNLETIKDLEIEKLTMELNELREDGEAPTIEVMRTQLATMFQLNSDLKKVLGDSERYRLEGVHAREANRRMAEELGAERERMDYLKMENLGLRAQILAMTEKRHRKRNDPRPRTAQPSRDPIRQRVHRVWNVDFTTAAQPRLTRSQSKRTVHFEDGRRIQAERQCKRRTK